MADANVKNAQIYLNAMFGGHLDWVPLEENGQTGTLTMEGIIRAFQIQNHVSATGAAGPLTLQKMKSLSPILKMDPDDEPSINVCLLQCALFCKGYAAGGITGIYYNSGVNAVKQLQEDANIGVTGIVNWKVWAALLSFNWFTAPASPLTPSDGTIQLIQRQLNADYSDYINVRACDGIMSRETALSLLGALQAAEGILNEGETITNLNELNFGDQTAAKFPGPLKVGNTKTEFNKLVQYALYFNGYNPGNFTGVFTENTRIAVSDFQSFYGLNGDIRDHSGEVGYQTMMSLLISRGDKERPAFACDCATVLNAQQAKDLKAAHYEVVGRYLTGTVGLEMRPKALTPAEIKRVTDAGLRIFPIYQDGGYYLRYFQNPDRGRADAVTAIKAAARLGFPLGTIIYFAVDFDCMPYEADQYIAEYFRQIHSVFQSAFNTNQYKAGIYAPRQVCTEISDRGYAVSSFVADMSSGFTGNCGYPLPSNWSFDQLWEIPGFSSSPSFDLDKTALSRDPARDKGHGTFTAVTPVSNEERIKALCEKYLRKFTSVVAAVDGIFSYNYAFIKDKIPLGTITCGPLTINNYITADSSLSIHPESGNKALIEIKEDKNGNISTEFTEKIQKLIKLLSFKGIEDLRDEILTKTHKIAEEMGFGDIYFTFKFTSLKSCELSIGWESGKLSLPADSEGNPAQENISLSIAYVMEIIYESNDAYFTEQYELESILAGTLVCTIAILGVVAITSGLGAGLVTTVTVSGDEILTALGSTGLLLGTGHF